jgi:hypothetical protein
LGVGVWGVHRTAWRSEGEVLHSGHAFALALSGASLLHRPDRSSFSVRGIIETSVLWTDPATHARFTVGPRVERPIGNSAVSFDLIIGIDALGRVGFTPHGGLRIGVRWD